jgi:geranylgeranyl diphosphate synthase type II
MNWMSLIPTTKATKSLIDQELKQLFKMRIQRAAEISPHYEALWKTLEKVAMAGGKRWRPHLTLLAYSAFGGKNSEAATKAALAQELMHIALLIHDDIIDRDITRHGELNMTGHFLDIYAEFLPKVAERRHYAESAAQLAGDLLISEAYRQLAEIGTDELHTALFEVIGGQLLDTEGSFRPEPTDPLTIARYKTASYSFVAPLITGAMLAGASKVQKQHLASFAEEVGIGFQLRDDLIGTFGNEKATGKSVDGDIREGKHTLIIETFSQRAVSQAKETFSQLFGRRDATDKEVGEVRTLLEKAGARQTVEARIDALGEEAQRNLKKLTISPEYRKAFEEMVQYCLYRDH